MRQERAGDQRRTLFERNQSSARRTASPGLVPSSREIKLELLAEHAAFGIDLVERHVLSPFCRGRGRPDWVLQPLSSPILMVSCAEAGEKLDGERGGEGQVENTRRLVIMAITPARCGANSFVCK